MDVIRAIESFEYYQSKTGVSNYAVWLMYRQQTAKAWRIVVYPKMCYITSVCAPEWLNGYQ